MIEIIFDATVSSREYLKRSFRVDEDSVEEFLEAHALNSVEELEDLSLEDRHALYDALAAEYDFEDRSIDYEEEIVKPHDVEVRS